MSLLQLCEWIENTAIGTAIREGRALYPLFDTIHLLGIAILFGSISLLDLRLLGIALKKEHVRDVAEQVLPWTWAGFGIMVITGVGLFWSEAVRCYYSQFFWVKMGLIMVAGVNAGIFQNTIYHRVGEWGASLRAPTQARVTGIVSLVVWTGVVWAGRWFAYF
jgi:hypothetical protein